MKPLSRTLPWAFALTVLAGCASTTVTSREEYTGPKLARPERIIVRDFAATPTDLADGSAAQQVALPGKPPTAQEVALGRQLGAKVATELASDIRAMALPGVTAQGQPAPRVGDIVIAGFFTSVQPGSQTERMVLGFGEGSAKLTTHVEGFRMTDQGLVRLGSGNLASGGGKTPGLAAPMLVAAATANPVGLIVGGGAKLYQYETGSDTIQAEAKRTADEIAAKLRPKFEEQGWI
jgi:hypothetical protein